MLLGLSGAINQQLRPLRIDLADMYGVFVEVKRLQVDHSVSDITFPILPHQTDLAFLQEEISATLNQALEELQDKTATGMTVLISAKFPKNTWVKYKKGERPSYDADSKLQIHMEYEYKLKGIIGMVLPRWKQLLRVKCGMKTFPMIGATKKAQKNKMKKYINLCNIHIAAMEALSGIELKGIKHIRLGKDPTNAIHHKQRQMGVSDGGANRGRVV